MSNTPSPQQGSPSQQQDQSGSAPTQQQGGQQPIFRDWAAI
jgi:hypothetical protein